MFKIQLYELYSRLTMVERAEIQLPNESLSGPFVHPRFTQVWDDYCEPQNNKHINYSTMGVPPK